MPCCAALDLARRKTASGISSVVFIFSIVPYLWDKSNGETWLPARPDVVAGIRIPGEFHSGTFFYFSGEPGTFFRWKAGEFALAVLDFAKIAQNLCFTFDVLVFSDRAFFEFDLQVEELLFQRSVIGVLLLGDLGQSPQDGLEAGEGEH